MPQLPHYPFNTTSNGLSNRSARTTAKRDIQWTIPDCQVTAHEWTQTYNLDFNSIGFCWYKMKIRRQYLHDSAVLLMQCELLVPFGRPPLAHSLALSPTLKSPLSQTRLYLRAWVGCLVPLTRKSKAYTDSVHETVDLDRLVKMPKKACWTSRNHQFLGTAVGSVCWKAYPPGMSPWRLFIPIWAAFRCWHQPKDLVASGAKIGSHPRNREFLIVEIIYCEIGEHRTRACWNKMTRGEICLSSKSCKASFHTFSLHVCHT